MSDLTCWNILIIDDEPDSLSLIYDMLALNGVTVHRADSGAEALAMLKAFTPTLVIADLSMPKPDGWDLLCAIRSDPATAYLPVVAITAYYSDKVEQQARKAGFNALIQKPIKIGSLLDKLQAVTHC